jgi:hypothetical protein
MVAMQHKVQKQEALLSRHVRKQEQKFGQLQQSIEELRQQALRTTQPMPAGGTQGATPLSVSSVSWKHEHRATPSAEVARSASASGRLTGAELSDHALVGRPPSTHPPAVLDDRFEQPEEAVDEQLMYHYALDHSMALEGGARLRGPDASPSTPRAHGMLRGPPYAARTPPPSSSSRYRQLRGPAPGDVVRPHSPRPLGSARPSNVYQSNYDSPRRRVRDASV